MIAQPAKCLTMTAADKKRTATATIVGKQHRTRDESRYGDSGAQVSASSPLIKEKPKRAGVGLYRRQAGKEKKMLGTTVATRSNDNGFGVPSYDYRETLLASE